MPTRAVAVAACLSAGALLLAGCDDASGSDAGGTAVVASAYPFAYVAERVGGDDVTVQNLTDPGVEPHDIELTPQQVADVGEADLLVYERGFQAAVDDAIELAGQDDDALLDVAEVVPPEDTGASTEGDESGLDPHVWLDPRHMVTITEAVADRLAAADPDNASAYRQRADALVADLTALDRDFERESGRLCAHHRGHQPRRIPLPRDALRPRDGADRGHRSRPGAVALGAGGDRRHSR